MGRPVPEISSAVVNESLGALAVYDKGGTILWQIPVPNAKELVAYENQSHIEHVQLADLFEDGKKEIITTISLPNDGWRRRLGRAFDSQQAVVMEKEFGDEHVVFRDKSYDASFMPLYPLVLDRSQNSSIQILVSALN